MSLAEKLKEATRPSMHEAAWCRSEPHANFVVEALKIAASDEDGHLPRSGNLSALSMYMGMLMMGWADRCGAKHHEPAPFRITESGREILKRCETASR